MSSDSARSTEESTSMMINDKNENEKKDDSISLVKKRRLSLTQTEDFNAKLKKRGIIYLSRIPPRMGPPKLKSLLSQHGIITRLYLAEEDKSARKRRLKASGNAKGRGGCKRYTEGWVEFEKKSVAKRLGQVLNNTPITNLKRDVHYGDLWNIKYLKHFKWDHLTEKVAYERRVKEQKIRLEMIHARRENQVFANLVEAGKTMDRIQQRRNKRNLLQQHQPQLIHPQQHQTTSTNIPQSQNNTSNQNQTKRRFKQNTPMDAKHEGKAKSAVLHSLV
mmetsp:Transcript_21630/g.30308  ORF Transcript_21630/g.30308 Transcript_21630/m.30308 type:complete len:276 (+) Transcript_21630:39-866(+)|eukprot:CAMPEP_0184866414 /NCGR_PEP_ID=MMETSP0580-20130426/22265_1 /TAXON_ID=1118495 /ORGANISM="Dactyliosolen fragilissimus" /LENGTH=275 /DNA_ID=CAMNT_0027366101 /DNA_START=34 /DNA_END=861 /DNA_ORIENTATION=-